MIADYAMPPWLLMWTIAFGIFWACKWFTWRRALRRCVPPPFASAGYLFGWVGMDVESFLGTGRFKPAPRPHDCFAASAKMAGGAALVILASRLSIDHDGLVVGWLGMVGLILFLHFGTFQLLAIAWWRRGVGVQPLMNHPLRAVSLAEFWGGRWNAAFNKLAHDIVFWPLARTVGPRLAVVGVFLASGLVHDAVISLPAGGGYGLPTSYFVLQGVALLFERSAPGRLLGLGRGWRVHAFTLAITALPAFWLFHPPFVRHVILPMLRAFSHVPGF